MAYIIAILFAVIIGLVWAQGINSTSLEEIERLKKEDEDT